MGSKLRRIRRIVPKAEKASRRASSDGPLIVYGAGCCWWDSIDKAGRRESSPLPLPCCPHCGSMLFQTSEIDWWSGAERQDKEQPGYLELLRWSRGRCFKNWDAARAAHAAETTAPVVSGG